MKIKKELYNNSMTWKSDNFSWYKSISFIIIRTVVKADFSLIVL